MDTSYEDEEEETPLVSISGLPIALRDNRKPYQKQLAVYLVLASLLCERIAFYSIAVNLALSLGTKSSLQWTYENILICSFIYSSTSYFSTMIFAVISDAKLGRAKTIVVGFFVYLLGYVLAILIVNPQTRQMICGLENATTALNSTTIFHEPCARGILSSLVVIAIGAGAVQANMAVLGAEQIQESKIASRFFDKYMIAVNIGSLIARLGIPSIKNEDHYYIGYAGAAGMLLIATLLFITGWKYYIHVKPYDTVVSKFFPVYKNAFETWRKHKSKTRSIGRGRLNSTTLYPSNTDDSLSSDEGSQTLDAPPSRFLDYAKVINHGKFHDRIVDDVNSLRNAFVIFALFIPYCAIYNQIYSSFSMQGQKMHSLPDDPTINWISLGDPVTIIVGILILNVFVYQNSNAGNWPVAIATKFVIGMSFAIMAMCIAGTIEIVRQNMCPTTPNDGRSDLKLYFQLPQYVGMGLSEMFALTASYEFAYFSAPRSAQSLFMGLRFFSLGLSSFIGFGCAALFASSSMRLDFSCTTLENNGWSLFAYFYILAGIQLVFIILFILCQRKYRFIKLNVQKIGTNQSS